MLTKNELECLTPTGRRMAGLLAAQETSGLGVGAFARARGLSPNTLSWWRGEIRRRLARQSRGVTEVHFAEAIVVDRPAAAAPDGARLLLDLGRARRVEVPVGFDAATFRRLLEVLSSC